MSKQSLVWIHLWGKTIGFHSQFTNWTADSDKATFFQTSAETIALAN